MGRVTGPYVLRRTGPQPAIRHPGVFVGLGSHQGGSAAQWTYCRGVFFLSGGAASEPCGLYYFLGWQVVHSRPRLGSSSRPMLLGCMWCSELSRKQLDDSYVVDAPLLDRCAGRGGPRSAATAGKDPVWSDGARGLSRPCCVAKSRPWSTRGPRPRRRMPAAMLRCQTRSQRAPATPLNRGRGPPHDDGCPEGPMGAGTGQLAKWRESLELCRTAPGPAEV